MVFDITHLKKIRKQLGLTQHAFAKQAAISQSMVAKIESGKLDPTYSYVKKIEQALEILTKQEEQEAKDIMHKKVISVKHDATIPEVIKIMTSNNISQVPVIEKERVIGLITETDILSQQEDTAKKKASDIMRESPPS